MSPRLRVPRSPWARVTIMVLVAAGVVAAIWWRGPAWSDVSDAFTVVSWRWVFAAIGLNLLSVIARSIAWRAVIDQAIASPRPAYRTVFAAFSVGLLANAVLPGRIGELARVAVLNRRMNGRRGLWATLVGTVFAHRVFDLVPVLLLILYVVATAKVPTWAITSLLVFIAVGVALFTLAFVGSRSQHKLAIDGAGAVRRVVAMARQGLGVMRSPLGASLAILFQMAGWICQILAVWAAMRAFHIYESLPAAGLVLLLMNVATVFPLWPGNVGLVQIAVATPLAASYGVMYAHGIAFGIGLQAIEASVGVGVGLLFLAREGLSFAILRGMPDASEETEGPTEESDESDRSAGEPERRLVGGRRC